MSFLNVADLYLNFVHVTCQSAAEMLPWYFVYDHLNYAGYIYEMLAVTDTHTSAAERLADGNFVVQQQNQYSFSRASIDQTNELTMNKDSKTRDGQIGFSNNANAVHH